MCAHGPLRSAVLSVCRILVSEGSDTEAMVSRCTCRIFVSTRVRHIRHDFCVSLFDRRFRGLFVGNIILFPAVHRKANFLVNLYWGSEYSDSDSMCTRCAATVLPSVGLRFLEQLMLTISLQFPWKTCSVVHRFRVHFPLDSLTRLKFMRFEKLVY